MSRSDPFAMNIIQHTHPQPHTCRTWLRRADYWPRTKRIAALISMLVAPGALAAEDHAAASGELLADFTGPDYAGWTVIGPAFGKSPDSLEGVDSDAVRRVASSRRMLDSGKGADGSLFSPEFLITADFINILIAGGDHPFRASATLWLDGKAIRTSTGGNQEKPYWVTWDVGQYRGHKALIGLHDLCIEDEMGYVIVERIMTGPSARARPGGNVSEALAGVRRQAVEAIRRNAARAAADPYRPIYHYTPPAQRMNDPNGPAWANGYHHVFYQHMVFVGHGAATNVHWGHARSKDLVNWETLPLAIHPAYDAGELSCFSGNLAWDKNGDPVQFVTMVPYRKGAFRQIWPARPLDPEWVRWERTPEFPPTGLVPEGTPAERNLKDAFPFSAGDRRFLVLTDRTIPIYEATDDRLATWVYRGSVDNESAECPNFFEVDGRWIYLSSPHEPVRYRIGNFDPVTAKFQPRTEGRMNHDMGFYASTAYRDNRGRTVLLGVTRGQKQGMGWTGALALPRILTIGPDDRPRMQPLPELESLRREPFTLNAPLALKSREVVIKGLTGDSMEIYARFRAHGAKSFGLRVRRSADGTRFLPVQWSNGEVIVGRATPKYPCRYEIESETNEVVFRIFLDKGILDSCTADGRIFESRIHYAPLDDLQVSVFAEGGDVTLVSLDAWRMDQAWIDHSRLFSPAL